MNGWQTAFAMYAEDAPGVRFRPSGVTSVRANTDPLQSWTKKTPFERRTREKAVITETKVTLQRFFVPDDFSALMLGCVCQDFDGTAGSMGVLAGETEKTFAIEARFPDGACIRYSGLALKSWELLIQSRRIVSEQFTFIALKTEEIESVNGATPLAVPMTPAKLATHRIDDSMPEVTGAEWAGDATRTFSTQLIFERKLSACNFTSANVATRHARGAWDVTGQGTVRLPSDLFGSAILEDTSAALFWRVPHPTLAASLKIAVPDAVIRINNQEQFAGEIEHTLDFHAQSSDNVTAFFSL